MTQLDQDPQAPSWLLDDEAVDPAAARPGHRGRLLLIAATIPWLIVLVIVGRAVVSPAAPASDVEAGVPTVGASAATAATAPQGTPTSSGGPRRMPTAAYGGVAGPRAAVTTADAAATAVVLARSWLTGVGPQLADVPAPPAGAPRAASYAEHLAVEAVDLPAPGFAVVTVIAIVLDVVDQGYGGGRAVRLAVPLRLDGRGARPAGDPWQLPAPDLAPEPPAPQTTIDDPAVLADAGSALVGAGYRDVDVHSVQSTEGWPLLVRATARAPGSDDATQHVVWLRVHLGALVVAGWLPQRDGPTTSATTSTTPPPAQPGEGAHP